MGRRKNTQALPSYKHKRFCSMKCGNSACSRNVSRIDKEDFKASDAMLALKDFSKECGTYMPTTIDTFAFLKEN